MQADSCPYRMIGRCIEISVGSGEAVGVIVIETAATLDVLTAGSVAGVGLWFGGIWRSHIVNPFVHITAHVVNSELVGLLLLDCMNAAVAARPADLR